MIESTPDPMDTFVRHVRTIAADNKRAIVGPASVAERENHYLVEVVVAAVDPTPDRSFTTALWNFEVKPASDKSHAMSAWDTWRFLAELLKRDFQSVEKYCNQLEFAQAVEKLWPCTEATAARERFELRECRRQEWNARRSAYIYKRENEGAKYADADLEFLVADPPDY